MKYALRCLLAACALVVIQTGTAGAAESSELTALERQVFFWTQPVSVFDPGFVVAEERVIDSNAALAKAWTTFYENRSSPPSSPEVDFEREVFVLIAMGKRGTGGYRISNLQATYTGHSILVEYAFQEPGANCIVPSSITSPALLMRMLKPKVPFEFKRSLLRIDCQ